MSKKIKSKIKNTSGWKCVEYRILILPDVVEEKTKGGIILPSKSIATIINFGSKAFDDGTWKDKPRVGDRIIIPTYCGYRITSNQTKDGKEYRSILDRDIVAMQISEETCQ